MEQWRPTDNGSAMATTISYGNVSSDTFTQCLLLSAANPDSYEYDVLKLPAFAVPVILLYVIIILVGTVGNTLVVVTVVRTRQLWTATNVFIANLALSDVFVLILDLPLSAYYQLTDDWAFGRVLCHLIPPTFAIVVYVSTLTLTLVAVDRYILIVYPLKNRMTVCNALILIAAVALISTGVAAPVAVFSKYIVFDDRQLKIYRRICMEKWPSPHLRLVYTICTLALQFFVPLVIIVILYSCIFFRVRSRMGRRRRRQTKTIKMLVSVVLVFFLCWTPFHLFALITEVDQNVVKGRYYKFVDVLLRVVAMSSSCANPFLYGWLNDNYRAAFSSLIRRPMVAPSVREETLEVSRSVAMNNRTNGYAVNNITLDEKVPLSDTKL